MNIFTEAQQSIHTDLMKRPMITHGFFQLLKHKENRKSWEKIYENLNLGKMHLIKMRLEENTQKQQYSQQQQIEIQHLFEKFEVLNVFETNKIEYKYTIDSIQKYLELQHIQQSFRQTKQKRLLITEKKLKTLNEEEQKYKSGQNPNFTKQDLFEKLRAVQNDKQIPMNESTTSFISKSQQKNQKWIQSQILEKCEDDQSEPLLKNEQT